MPGATTGRGRRLAVRLSENNRIVHRQPALSRIKFTFRPRRRPFATLFPFLRVAAPPRDAGDARLGTNTPSLPPLSHISIPIPATLSASPSAPSPCLCHLLLFTRLSFASFPVSSSACSSYLPLCSLARPCSSPPAVFASPLLFRSPDFLLAFHSRLPLRPTPLLSLGLCSPLASLAFDSSISSPFPSPLLSRFLFPAVYTFSSVPVSFSSPAAPARRLLFRETPTGMLVPRR